MGKGYDEINGVKVRFRQVPLAVIDEINRKIKDPPPPKVKIEAKSTPEEPYFEDNPNDPQYKDDLREAARERGEKTINAMIILAVELVDPLPEDDHWLAELEFTKMITGSPDLSEYDLEDDRIKQFVFKKFYVIGQQGYNLIARKTGVSEEEIEEMAASFPGDEEGVPDTDSSPQEGS